MPFIEHVTLSSADYERYTGIMLRGNPLLKRWANTLLGLRKHRVFRKMLLEGKFDPSRYNATPEQVASLEGDLPAILAVRECVEPMVASNAKAIWMLAMRFGRRRHGTMLDAEDFEMEGWLAAQDCVWGWSNTKAVFNTYLMESVTRRLHAICKKASPFAGITDAMRFLSIIKRTQHKMSNATFDEAADARGLSASERERARAAQVQQLTETFLSYEIKKRSSEGVPNDYTVLGKAVTTQPADDEFDAILDRAELSEFERAVVLASQLGDYGWQAKVAKTHINPKTNRPYSRAAVRGVLEHAWTKLKSLMAA